MGASPVVGLVLEVRRKKRMVKLWLIEKAVKVSRERMVFSAESLCVPALCNESGELRDLLFCQFTAWFTTSMILGESIDTAR